MRAVLYHRHAVRYLRRMPADRKAQVKAAVDEVAALDDPLSHANVKALG
jgi:phage-related protein